MAFLLNEEFAPPAGGDEEISRLVAQLRVGKLVDRKPALKRLVALKAEPAFTALLGDADALTVQLATSGLWECWLNEKGAEARARIDLGIEHMDAGEMKAAAGVFGALMDEFPDWAEAINKQATLLYVCGQPASSLELCRKVVALKPHHFGAWNGMALCAVQLEDWPTALRAAQEALNIQPGAKGNLEIIRLARGRIC
jgi:tetratricopeptide (TPR) repeat protein